MRLFLLIERHRLSVISSALFRSMLVAIVLCGCCGVVHADNTADDINDADGEYVLRRISVEDMRYLYELPTTFLKNSVFMEFEKSPSLGFVIVDPDVSKALTNGFVASKTKTDAVTPADVTLDSSGNTMIISPEEYADVRFSIISELYNGSQVDKNNPLAFPMSILYSVEEANKNAIDIRASYTNKGYFDTESDGAYHPWIAGQSLESNSFSIYFNLKWPCYIAYQNDDNVFILDRTDPGYNIGIYQFDNFSIRATSKDHEDVTLSIRHRLDDPVLADNIYLNVLFNDGSTPTTAEMLKAPQIKLHTDGKWLETTTLKAETNNTADGMDPEEVNTLWMLPICSLSDEDGTRLFPIGRMMNEELAIQPDDESLSIPTVVEPTSVTSIYYTLQGNVTDYPIPGNIYIKVSGNKAEKILYQHP